MNISSRIHHWLVSSPTNRNSDVITAVPNVPARGQAPRSDHRVELRADDAAPSGSRRRPAGTSSGRTGTASGRAAPGGTAGSRNSTPMSAPIEQNDTMFGVRNERSAKSRRSSIGSSMWSSTHVRTASSTAPMTSDPSTTVLPQPFVGPFGQPEQDQREAAAGEQEAGEVEAARRRPPCAPSA